MKEVLQKIGLDSKESEIYLLILRIGSSTASEISKKSLIDRRTVYDVLSRLISKGFVSYYKKNNVKSFSAMDPKHILEEISKKQTEFKQIIPQLQSLKLEHSEETEVEIFKGKEGIKAIFNDIINSKAEHYAFGDVNEFGKFAKLETIQFINKIRKLGLKEKIIYAKGTKIDKYKQGTYRAIAKELLPPTNTIIYKDKVALFTFTPPYSIIRIKSPLISKTYLNYFNTFWKLGEKI